MMECPRSVSNDDWVDDNLQVTVSSDVKSVAMRYWEVEPYAELAFTEVPSDSRELRPSDEAYKVFDPVL
jgi:hypothetical protein